jgi:ABC-type microcin C transport system duplicated ATPase subunit YejF
MESRNQILEVNNLETQFSTWEGVVHAVNGVSFNLAEGEPLGLSAKAVVQKRNHVINASPDPFTPWTDCKWFRNF